ncbi:AbrB family transcriptional regulator [Actinopolyspora saharensis]|nr:AbrB family transcriptional regulator [Actinopolyspora saharensis]
MTSASVKMTPQGRVSIFAQFRNELGWSPETDLVEYREGSRVVIEPRAEMVERIQNMALGARIGSGSVVDELIASRRAENETERNETEGGY